jgi:signal transduction histidine kinase
MSSIKRLLTPLTQRDTYLVFLFLLAAVPLGAATLGVLIGGWVGTGVLFVTPLVVPVAVAFRFCVGLLAAGDAALARQLFGVDVRPRVSSGGTGWWGRGKAIALDSAFWLQQAYLVVRMVVGFALAVGMASLAAVALFFLTYPAWYRWNELHIRAWHFDTFGHSWILVPVGAVLVVATAWIARGLGVASRLLVTGLLAERNPSLPRLTSRELRLRALRIHAAVAVFVALVLVVIWALSGHGYFWPEWALMPLLLLVLGTHAWVELVEDVPRLRKHRALLIHIGLVVQFSIFYVLIWALTNRGYFWPVWPILAALITLGLHGAGASVWRATQLRRRVGVLETTRAGAVDEQEANLRRIERDLHDGAQARLVALGMNLGLAEQKLASDPEVAQQLVAEARAGIVEALGELRDLARGIHPPVLTDRGLGAALATLADRSAVPVSVDVELAERPPQAVETAAYFVAAESLANASKHAGPTKVAVAVRRRGDLLDVRITDDGRGGADPAGSGLTGLRRRVEALDGQLEISSPPGGPTTVHAELPCGS